MTLTSTVAPLIEVWVPVPAPSIDNFEETNKEVVIPLPETASFVEMADVDVPQIGHQAAAVRRAGIIKSRFIRLGLATTAAMQMTRAGGFLLEHSVAFYTYAQYAPNTLWRQYFCANATHVAAMKILSTNVFGVSISSITTVTVALAAGLIVAKGGAAIYNLCVEKEKKFSLSLMDMISDLFASVFRFPLV